MSSTKVKVFSLASYIKTALNNVEYEQDESGVVVAFVPEVAGFYSQGDTREEAGANLEDAIEGNVLLALQLGWEIPVIPDFEIRDEIVETDPT